MPELMSPRCGSPPCGCSILMTSAPHSAMTAPAAGTNVHAASSITRTPSNGLLMHTLTSRATSGSVTPAFTAVACRNDASGAVIGVPRMSNAAISDTDVQRFLEQGEITVETPLSRASIDDAAAVVDARLPFTGSPHNRLG